MYHIDRIAHSGKKNFRPMAITGEEFRKLTARIHVFSQNFRIYLLL